MSIQQEIDATVNVMKNTRLRTARLIDKVFREVDTEKASLEDRLRVIGLLTKALKDLGTNIGQLRAIQKEEISEEEKDAVTQLLS